MFLVFFNVYFVNKKSGCFPRWSCEEQTPEMSVLLFSWDSRLLPREVTQGINVLENRLSKQKSRTEKTHSLLVRWPNGRKVLSAQVQQHNFDPWNPLKSWMQWPASESQHPDKMRGGDESHTEALRLAPSSPYRSRSKGGLSQWNGRPELTPKK